MKKTLALIFVILAFVCTQAFGASLIVQPKFSVYNAGTPLSGGKIDTYDCGTTTPKTTYTTHTEGAANTNPVILDSNGEASIYARGCLKIRISDSDDTVLDTIDNVYSFDSGTLQDTDRDTKIQMEESADEDVIRFDVAGVEKLYIDSTGIHTTAFTFDQGKGDLRRPVYGWTDSDTITIGSGGAYHHAGTTNQFVYWTSEISFDSGTGGSNADNDALGNDTWYYLYVDDSAVVTQASAILDADCFLLVDDAPTWSGTKFGYYGDGVGKATTSDRCIFAVTTNQAASTIFEYYHDGGSMVFPGQLRNIESTTAANTTWTDITAFHLPSFARRVKANFRIHWIDTASINLTWRTNGSSAAITTGHTVGLATAANAYDHVSIDVITDSSYLIEVKEDSATAGTFTVFQEAWYLPHGM